eukprot:TRINITY_DN56685_c0_g1_i1.p1 TRINITY_DN56685_c0_g1~~TRINITY_DN56685_c0_g1_i1.p1  ORF type:complete len:739 (-),score=87.32 TRINITY_DN56685_c0_g1_i1:157-2373(-)
MDSSSSESDGQGSGPRCGVDDALEAEVTRGGRWLRFCCMWAFLGIVSACVTILVVYVRTVLPPPASVDVSLDIFSERRAWSHLQAFSTRAHAVREGSGKVAVPDDGNIAVFDYAADYLGALGSPPTVMLRGRRSLSATPANQSASTETESSSTQTSSDESDFGLFAEVPISGLCQTPALGLDCSAQVAKGDTAFNYVAVRIKGTGAMQKAFLLTCHLDSPPTQFAEVQKELWEPLVEDGRLTVKSTSASKGASDDGQACAQLLEVARGLVHSPPIADVIVLLTNGGLLGHIGAHRFIQDDPWFKDVALFLEQDQSASRGLAFANFGESVFLAEEYARSAPYPRSSPALQDLSDWHHENTDGVLFRASGIPGITMYATEDRCPYQSEFDTIDRVLPGTMQGNGANMLAVVRRLAGRSDVAQQWAVSDAPSADHRAVSFDVLSKWSIAVSWTHSILITTGLCIVAFAHVILELRSELFDLRDRLSKDNEGFVVEGYESSRLDIFAVLPRFFFVFLLTVVAHQAALLTPVCQAILLVDAGKEGTWYKRDAFAFVLYGGTSLLGAMVANWPLRWRCFGRLSVLRDRTNERLSGCATVVLHAFASLVLLGMGFRCAYLLTVMMTCRVVGMTLRRLLSCRGDLCECWWWMEVVTQLPAAILWVDTVRTLALNPIQSMGTFGSFMGIPEVDVALFSSLIWQVAVPFVVFALRAGNTVVVVAFLILFVLIVSVLALILPVADFYPC